VIALTIYSRPGCHLCDEMKAIVDRTLRAAGTPVRIEQIDISGNADLEAKYGLEIPVLMVDGRKVAKYRISDEELLRVLTAREAEGQRRSLPFSP
jgi:hypothetical protein